MLKKDILATDLATTATLRFCFFPFHRTLGEIQSSIPFIHTRTAVSSNILHDLNKASLGTLVQVQPKHSNLQISQNNSSTYLL